MDGKGVRHQLASPHTVLADGMETPVKNTFHGALVGTTQPEIQEMEYLMGLLPALFKKGTLEDRVGMATTWAAAPAIVVICEIPYVFSK
jgi:hypothetical protein